MELADQTGPGTRDLGIPHIGAPPLGRSVKPALKRRMGIPDVRIVPATAEEIWQEPASLTDVVEKTSSLGRKSENVVVTVSACP